MTDMAAKLVIETVTYICSAILIADFFKEMIRHKFF